MSAPAAGWYPDPRGAAGTYRWWDGTGWSHELSSDPRAAAPTDESHPPTGESDPVHPPPKVRYDPTLNPAYQPTYRRPLRTDDTPRRPSLPVIVGVAVLVLLVATVAVVFGVRGRAVSATPPLVPPAPLTASPIPVSLDETSRRAVVGDVTASFPGPPWESASSDEPGSLDGLFTGYAVAQTTVHPKYNGKDDWTAALFLGALDPDLVVEGDEAATAEAVQAQLVSRFYGNVTVTPGKAKTTDSTVSGRAVATRQIDFRLQAKGLPSAYDRVSVLVIGPDPDQPTDPTIAFVSMRPNDLATTSRSQLDATINSINFV